MTTKTKEAQRALHAKRKAAGLCFCGHEPTLGYKTCTKHRNAARDNYYKNQKARIDKSRNHYLKNRDKVLKHYGAFCACCGETELLFLQLDHVNNDGYLHRAKVGRNAQCIFRDCIRQGFPDSFQILCANCNWGKMRNKGICPHKTAKLQ